MAITFGSRQSARKLRESGLEESQADAITEVVEELAEATDEAIEEAKTQLVTKEYLDARFAEFRAEMRAQFAEMRAEFAEFRAEMYRGQNRLLLLMFGVNATIATAAIAIMRLT